MSHVATVDVEIKSLDDLDTACRRIGLELVRGQQTYRWFGTGDETPVDGIPLEDQGVCEHAIRVPLGNPLYERPEDQWPWEIGIVKRPDGPGYILKWDPFGGARGLAKFVGGYACPLLKQAYALAADSGRLSICLGDLLMNSMRDGTH